MRPFFFTWLTICLCLPVAAEATNRYQPLPAHATGRTATTTDSSTSSSLKSASVQPAQAAKTQQAKDSSSVLGRAVNTLGVRYRWGGTTPEKGFDCSGLVRYAFNNVDDVDLSRTSNQMAREDGEKISRSQLQPGDLLFFNIRSRRVNHVAIYLGNDRFIHAPRGGKTVTIDTLNKPYWKTHYALAKRVLPSSEPQLRVTTR
jgi:cell wall-associated NlpC family hydrolase